MVRLITWLRENSVINLAAVFIYMLVVVFLHDTMVQFSVWIMNNLTIIYYDLVIAIVAVIVAGVFSFLFLRQLIQNEGRRIFKVILLVFTFGALLLHAKYLFVVNVEMIHFVEFAILAFLLYPISRRFGFTMFLATIGAYIDEWYQYIILYPDRESYFDFNDTLMDQLGMGLALLMIYNYGLKSPWKPNIKEWITSPGMIVVFVIMAVSSVLFLTDVIVPYQSQATDVTWLVLNEANNPGAFFKEFLTSGRYYHVLTPWEGFFLNFLLIAIYSLMDWL